MKQQGHFGFTTQTVDVRTSDGLDDVLLTPLTYVSRDRRVYRSPIGGTTNGVSAPRCVQGIIPATGEAYWMCGVLHDAAYRGQLLVMEESCSFHFLPANLTQKQSDNLLLEAMVSQKVGWLKRHTIYFAVRLFGFAAFNRDRKQ